MSESLIEITPVDPRSPEAVELIHALSEELARRYDYVTDGAGNFKPEDALVARSAYVVGGSDGRAVACGAFRPLECKVAEIKRKFVVPEHRDVVTRKRSWQNWSDSQEGMDTQPSA